MSHNILQVIAHYNMTPKEASAFKIACMYEHLLEKLFPNMRYCTLGKGDPRKKEVWKYAWKLITEREGQLLPVEYKLYVYAQLKVFKAYLDEGKQVFIRPNCLASEKGWKRWLLFKKKYEERNKFQTVEQAGVKLNEQSKVEADLLKTKDYFSKRFGKLNPGDIVTALERGSLQRWVTMRQVSGYYPWVSELVGTWLKEKSLSVRDYFGHGIEVYRSGITPEVSEFFRSEFKHEYE